MLTLSIAWRNIVRNGRRSAITVLTMALGGAALLLLGGLMEYVVLQLQTSTVRQTGHLAVFKRGYFAFGAGNPAGYGIESYDRLIDVIRRDPRIAPRLVVATPTQILAGVAGNQASGASKTFLGRGIVMADRLQMRDWNDYGLEGVENSVPPLREPDGVAIGAGLARMLQVCTTDRSDRCEADNPPPPKAGNADGALDPEGQALLALAGRDEPGQRDPHAAPGDARAAVELLAATVGGAPNVVTARVERIDRTGTKELDDNQILMQLPLAQRLVYGRARVQATAINLQLQHTADVPAVRAALEDLFARGGDALEVKDYVELNTMYAQTQSFFRFLFGFMALVIVVIVLFTIMNTMGMSVMERISEVGTVRSLGVQRSGVRTLFLTEGVLQGLLGATLAAALAALVVAAVNAANLTWTPPTAAGDVPFKLHLYGGGTGLLLQVWVLLACAAAVAALVPAHKASKMEVVDALRHV